MVPTQKGFRSGGVDQPQAQPLADAHGDVGMRRAIDQHRCRWARAAEGLGGRKSAVEKARARAYFCRAPRALAMI
jgi:hypothetical protein